MEPGGGRLPREHTWLDSSLGYPARRAEPPAPTHRHPWVPLGTGPPPGLSRKDPERAQALNQPPPLQLLGPPHGWGPLPFTIPQFSSAAGFLRGESRMRGCPAPPCAGGVPSPPPPGHGQQPEAAFGEGAAGRDPPPPAAEEGQQQEAGAKHEAADEQQHQQCGVWGQRVASAPCHLPCPRGTQGCQEPTAGSQNWEVKPSACRQPGERGQPHGAPTGLLGVQGDTGDGRAAGRAAGGDGERDLLVVTGRCGAERVPSASGPPLGAPRGCEGCGTLTVGPWGADPHCGAAQQGHLHGDALVPAVGCDTQVAGHDRGDEGVGDLPAAVHVAFKHLAEAVGMAPELRAGAGAHPNTSAPAPTLSSWPPLPL